MKKRIAAFLLALILSAAIAWTLRPRSARTLMEASELDAKPTWNWQQSRALLTQPGGFCAPQHIAPGSLLDSHLLAWRVVQRIDGGGLQRQVLWWGHFRTETGVERWVLTDGSASDSQFSSLPHMHTWSQRYTCDSSNEKHYLVFDFPPRALNVRIINDLLRHGYPDPGLHETEFVIRRETWKVLLHDSPAIATNVIP